MEGSTSFTAKPELNPNKLVYMDKNPHSAVLKSADEELPQEADLQGWFLR